MKNIKTTSETKSFTWLPSDEFTSFDKLLTLTDKKYDTKSTDNTKPKDITEESHMSEDTEKNSCLKNGEINCNGGTVSGYTTSYICEGGSYSTVRDSLGDTWHVTAKNVCTNYGVTWYELWDSDDGDYYGWVDSNYIDFY